MAIVLLMVPNPTAARRCGYCSRRRGESHMRWSLEKEKQGRREDDEGPKLPNPEALSRNVRFLRQSLPVPGVRGAGLSFWLNSIGEGPRTCYGSMVLTRGYYASRGRHGLTTVISRDSHHEIRCMFDLLIGL